MNGWLAELHGGGVQNGGSIPDFLLQFFGVGDIVAHEDLVLVIGLEAFLQLGGVKFVSNET